MAVCAQTSCGKAYIKYKALKELNAKGIYEPEQIEDAINRAWGNVVSGEDKPSDEQAKEIFKQAVDALGALGDGNGFEEEQWKKNSKIAKPPVIGCSKASMKMAVLKTKGPL